VYTENKNINTLKHLVTIIDKFKLRMNRQKIQLLTLNCHKLCRNLKRDHLKL